MPRRIALAWLVAWVFLMALAHCPPGDDACAEQEDEVGLLQLRSRGTGGAAHEFEDVESADLRAVSSVQQRTTGGSSEAGDESDSQIRFDEEGAELEAKTSDELHGALSDEREGDDPGEFEDEIEDDDILHPDSWEDQLAGEGSVFEEGEALEFGEQAGDGGEDLRDADELQEGDGEVHGDSELDDDGGLRDDMVEEQPPQESGELDADRVAELQDGRLQHGLASDASAASDSASGIGEPEGQALGTNVSAAELLALSVTAVVTLVVKQWNPHAECANADPTGAAISSNNGKLTAKGRTACLAFVQGKVKGWLKAGSDFISLQYARPAFGINDAFLAGTGYKQIYRGPDPGVKGSDDVRLIYSPKWVLVSPTVRHGCAAPASACRKWVVATFRHATFTNFRVTVMSAHFPHAKNNDFLWMKPKKSVGPGGKVTYTPTPGSRMVKNLQDEIKANNFAGNFLFAGDTNYQNPTTNAALLTALKVPRATTSKGMGTTRMRTCCLAFASKYNPATKKYTWFGASLSKSWSFSGFDRIISNFAKFQTDLVKKGANGLMLNKRQMEIQNAGGRNMHVPVGGRASVAMPKAKAKGKAKAKAKAGPR